MGIAGSRRPMIAGFMSVQRAKREPLNEGYGPIPSRCRRGSGVVGRRAIRPRNPSISTVKALLMSTEFKLVFEGEPDLEIAKFQQSLSSDFEIIQRGDDVYVRIKSATAEDPRCQYLIDRELDRHFFLTFVKIRAKLVRTTAWNAVEIRYSIHGSLPDDIRPQNWDYKLPIQLRLWSIAADTNDIWAKLILLFQIIELTYSERLHYEKYDNDATVAPHPLTECKFVRHLVVHSGNVCGLQLKLYCAYIGFPEVMLDITDPAHYRIIASKVPLMETEAKNVIERALSPRFTAPSPAAPHHP